jgi:hypothetical protein
LRVHWLSRIETDLQMGKTVSKQSAVSICVEIELIGGVVGCKVTTESQRLCHRDAIVSMLA